MEVTVLRKTEDPERLACRAARGDYFDGFVGDVNYYNLMSSVDYDQHNVEQAADLHPNIDTDFIDSQAESDSLPRYIEVEAATHSFVNKQLSRGHYGPWEHPQITFAVKGVSRVTMAQITRHRHMTFDVQSQRYVDFSEKETIDPQSLLDPDHFSRETGLTDLDDDEREAWLDQYQTVSNNVFEMYEQMVADGVPKEDARFILPVGTPVNMTLSGNARTMMHVLNLRQKANAQWEVRQLSEQIAEELREWMPYTGQWWQDNGPVKISP